MPSFRYINKIQLHGNETQFKFRGEPMLLIHRLDGVKWRRFSLLWIAFLLSILWINLDSGYKSFKVQLLVVQFIQDITITVLKKVYLRTVPDVTYIVSK